MSACICALEAARLGCGFVPVALVAGTDKADVGFHREDAGLPSRVRSDLLETFADCPLPLAE